MMAANMLDVDMRTVQNWEKGTSAIPYAAFRLIRLAGGYALLGKAWEDWTVWDGRLFTPAGRSFLPHELEHVGTFISLARHFLKTRENPKTKNLLGSNDLRRAEAHRQILEQVAFDENRYIASGKASGATAPSDARPCHEAVVIAVDFGQQGKDRRRTGDSFTFGRLEKLEAAANEALYG